MTSGSSWPRTREALARLREALRRLRRVRAIIRLVNAIRGMPAEYRHRNRRSMYAVLGKATLQASDLTLLKDDANMVLYRGADGALYVRAFDEFTDGRFELIS